MIIRDIETIRDYLAVNQSFDVENVKPYLKKAERSFLKPIIGAKQLKVFETAATDTIVIEAQELVYEVIANYGYYLYLPIGAVQITDNGIQVVDNDHTKTATDKQFKELQRSFLTTAHEALDELLLVMEQSADKFKEWFNSEYYSEYADLLVSNTKVFNECYYIFNSRQTFIALKSKLRTVEDRFIKSVIGDDLLLEIKKPQTDKLRKKAKKYLQQSVVAFTIYVTIDSGMFVLDAQGMKMRFDVLPYEKAVPKEFSRHSQFKENKKIEGEEYLKMAMDVIKNNPTVFPEYIEKTTGDYIKIIKTKGFVGI